MSYTHNDKVLDSLLNKKVCIVFKGSISTDKRYTVGYLYKHENGKYVLEGEETIVFRKSHVEGIFDFQK